MRCICPSHSAALGLEQLAKNVPVEKQYSESMFISFSFYVVDLSASKPMKSSLELDQIAVGQCYLGAMT